jgi:glycosyltransferase involved in cell wall biosynthesis
VRICLISAEHSPWGGIGYSHRRLARTLAARHEVTVIHSGAGGETGPSLGEQGIREVVAAPGPELSGMTFCGEEHRGSAAVLEAIEDSYGAEGPDYVETCDYRAQGLVALQARRAGHPLFERTLFGVRVVSAAELVALHDGTLGQPGMRKLAQLEREQLRLADRLLWRGGDVLDLYRRFYPFPLPEAVLIRTPFDVPAEPPSRDAHDPAAPLRILYVGRLQRCKGALDLAEACQRLPFDDWQLTMIGADTPTGPAGQSVRLTIESMFGDDPRLRLREPLPHEELQRCWPEHDLLVIPSRLEAWPNVGLEAMRAGLPILATPVGGLPEMVEHGVTGWLADDVGPLAIRRGLARIAAEREELERVRVSGAAFKCFLALTDPARVLECYEGMLAAVPRPTPGRAAAAQAARPPLVSVVTPYYRAAPYVREAVESVLAQTHEQVEAVIVNDGSFEHDDEVLARLAEMPRVRLVTQPNLGEGAARNLGIRLARGEYVAMLDADNVLEPGFVARALELLRGEPELAYVTCWLRFVAADGLSGEEAGGYCPLGNRVLSEDDENWDGDTLALLPRRVFGELGYAFEERCAMQSDWELYRCLRDDGRFGAVIPEFLARYRVLPGSLLRAHAEAVHRRSWDESLDRRTLRRTRWTVGG